jgi:ribonuclease Z
MQSMADQITAVWSRRIDGVNGLNGHLSDPAARKRERRTIAARDFMVVRLPAHELTDIERAESDARAREAAAVMASWEEHGGVWVGEEGQQVWIGVEDPPQ